MNFLQNMDSQFVTWAAIAVIVVLGLLMVNNKLRRGLIYVVRAAIGAAIIFVINFALGGAGFFVGVNVLTVAIAAFLGIPGIIMLYGLSFFM